MTQLFFALAQKVSLKPSFLKTTIEALEKLYRKDLLSGQSGVQNLKKELVAVEEKLNKLLDAHLDNLISVEEYREKKNQLMEEKTALSQKISDFERQGNNWFELAKEFLLELNSNKIKALKRKYQELFEFVKKSRLELLFTESAALGEFELSL